MHLRRLGARFPNGVEGHPIEYTVNCLETCLRKQCIQEVGGAASASALPPPRPRAHPPHQAFAAPLCRVAHTWYVPGLTCSLDTVKVKGPEGCVCVSHLSAQSYFLLVHLLTSGPQVTYLFVKARC